MRARLDADGGVARKRSLDLDRAGIARRCSVDLDRADVARRYGARTADLQHEEEGRPK
jgi:hypothetical protein